MLREGDTKDTQVHRERGPERVQQDQGHLQVKPANTMIFHPQPSKL